MERGPLGAWHLKEIEGDWCPALGILELICKAFIFPLTVFFCPVLTSQLTALPSPASRVWFFLTLKMCCCQTSLPFSLPRRKRRSEFSVPHSDVQAG